MSGSRSFQVALVAGFVVVIGCSEDAPRTTGGAGVGGASAGAGASLGGTAAGTAGTQGGAGASGMSGAGGVAGSAGSGGQSGSSGAGGVAGAGAMGGAGGAGAGGGGGQGGMGGAMGGDAGASAGGVGGGGSGGSSGMGAYNPCPMDGSPCKILPFGDSITDGYNIPGGYRIEFFSNAEANGKNFTFVGGSENGPTMVDGQPFPRQHEGHSGWKIAQIADLIPSPAFNDDPHIVLLMIGTNDVNQNDNLGAAPDRLESLLDDIMQEAPDALVVVASLIPLPDQAARVDTFNEAVPGVVEKQAGEGQHVLMVDMFTGFPTSELADGIHPNEAGYARMAGVWYDAVGELLP